MDGKPLDLTQRFDPERDAYGEADDPITWLDWLIFGSALAVPFGLGVAVGYALAGGWSG